MLLPCCFTFNTASVYYDSVASAFSVGRGQVGLYMTFVYASACVANLLWAGKMLQKLDVRVILSIAVVLVGGALIAMSQAQSITVFYIAGIALGIANAWLLWLIVPVMVGRWFKKNVGFLIGIAMAMTSIGGTVFSPMLAQVIINIGWRIGYLAQGIIVLVVCLPLIIFVIRSRPSDKGLEPLGSDDPAVIAAAQTTASGTQDGITLRQAFKKPSAFILCCVFAGIVNLGLTMNYFLPSFTTSIGYDLTIGALVASCVMFSSLVGKVVLGWLNDRSVVISNLVGCVPMIFGLALMMVFGPQNPIWLYVGAVFFGFFFAVQPTNVPQLVRKVFGNVSYDRIFAYVAVAMPLCAAVGSSFWGFVYDLTGSYNAAFMIDMGFSLVAIVALFAVLNAGKKLAAWAKANPDPDQSK
jgi:MFS family permease